MRSEEREKSESQDAVCGMWTVRRAEARGGRGREGLYIFMSDKEVIHLVCDVRNPVPGSQGRVPAQCVQSARLFRRWMEVDRRVTNKVRAFWGVFLLGFRSLCRQTVRD